MIAPETSADRDDRPAGWNSVSIENSGDSTEIVRDCVSGHGLSYAVSFVHVEATRSPDNPQMLPDLDLISRALQHAPLASLDDDARIWKATRRHIIGNIHSIVVKATNDVDCRFHIRNYLRACLARKTSISAVFSIPSTTSS